MKTFECVCGQRLFFDNTQCMNCYRRVGWCPVCQNLTAIEPMGYDDLWRCARPECGATLRLCHNYSHHGVCNRCIDATAPPPGGTDAEPLCDMCQFNHAIPDQSVPGNHEHWQRLESAKRRVLRQYQLWGLPPFSNHNGPPLSFDFLADALPSEEGWRPMGDEQVFTGHETGRITINIREADSVERERLRVSLGESYRTLIGHFRHELAHYLYDCCIAGSDLMPDFTATFGDPHAVPYDQAMENYYANGPDIGWQNTHVSAYATMHPHEDWAETVATLFHGQSLLETAHFHGHHNAIPREMTTPDLIDRMIEMAVFVNEVNRDMGMLDVLPVNITDPVRAKMSFVRDALLRS